MLKKAKQQIKQIFEEAKVEPYGWSVNLNNAEKRVLDGFDELETALKEVFKRDEAKEFVQVLERNAKPLYKWIEEGNTKLVVIPLSLALANYSNTEHVLNKLKEFLC